MLQDLLKPFMDLVGTPDMVAFLLVVVCAILVLKRK